MSLSVTNSVSLSVSRNPLLVLIEQVLSLLPLGGEASTGHILPVHIHGVNPMELGHLDTPYKITNIALDESKHNMKLVLVLLLLLFVWNFS